MSALMVGPDSRVTLHFSLSLADGELVDSTFDQSPASLEIGDGSLLPGFERCLFGLRPGDRERFRIPPEDGFGQPNPNNVQRIARSSFSSEFELAEGLVISFADAGRGELPGVVAEFNDEEVVVDFNHPLAGRELLFEVEILAVESAAGETTA